MDFQAIIQAVQTIGISALMCLLMAWFVKYMFDKFMEKNDVTINALKTSVDNNTLAFTKLYERLGGEKKNEGY